MKIPDEKGFYVYLLECQDGSYYCGWTNDLEKRIAAHNDGKGAKYTKGRRPCVLVYYESLSSKSLALSRENYIKKMSKIQKKDLINTL